MPLTLTIEHHDDNRLFLCADDGRESKPLAFFFSREAAQVFADALNAARAVAHAQGESGI